MNAQGPDGQGSAGTRRQIKTTSVIGHPRLDTLLQLREVVFAIGLAVLACTAMMTMEIAPTVAWESLASLFVA